MLYKDNYYYHYYYYYYYYLNLHLTVAICFELQGKLRSVVSALLNM